MARQSRLTAAFSPFAGIIKLEKEWRSGIAFDAGTNVARGWGRMGNRSKYVVVRENK